MKNFSYVKATDKTGALAALAEIQDVKVIAGGTNILPSIREGRINDATLLDIRSIKELRSIREEDDQIVLGPLTTIKDLETSEIIQKYAHGLWQAALSFADPTTRNSATVGGNIINASPAADTVTPLLALRAVITLEKKGSSRDIQLNEFFCGKDTTIREADELLTKIAFKKTSHSAFIKLGLRNAMSISAANVAVACEYDGNKVTDVRIAMGCMSPYPTRCYHAEKVLEGKEITQPLLDEMGVVLNASDINPHSGLRATEKYRRQVAPVLVARALKAACECSGQGGVK